MSDESDHTVWIRTERDPSRGSYVVTIEHSDDRSIALTKGGAMRYAMAVLTAVQYAHYDAAVFAQMRNVTGQVELAGQVLVDLRRDRPPLDPKPTAPLTFEPGVSAFRGVGYLDLRIDGKPVGQWDLDQAREHAMAVLEAAITADLDTLYFRELTGLIGLEPERAGNVVADLGSDRHRQEGL